MTYSTKKKLQSLFKKLGYWLFKLVYGEIKDYKPINNYSDTQIKKSQIAINAADARPSRFTGGERIDCGIAEIDISKRKATLSIKLLEEIQKKEALEKYGSEGSGKNLPFSSLSDDLKKKDKEKK